MRHRCQEIPFGVIGRTYLCCVDLCFLKDLLLGNVLTNAYHTNNCPRCVSPRRRIQQQFDSLSSLGVNRELKILAVLASQSTFKD